MACCGVRPPPRSAATAYDGHKTLEMPLETHIMKLMTTMEGGAPAGTLAIVECRAAGVSSHQQNVINGGDRKSAELYFEASRAWLMACLEDLGFRV